MNTDTIKPNELRIGNWVNESVVDLEKGSWKLNPIQVDGNRIKCIELGDVVRAIPISSTILVNAGYIEVEGNAYYRFFDFEDFRVFVHLNDNSSFISYKGSVIDAYTNNLHLHHLQNIHYSLTQSELKIQLQP